MRLTRFTDYSLRVLMYAGVKDPELCSIREIAERYGIPRTHLMKVVHELGRSGYLETVRGRGGGLRLGRPPKDIVLGQLVRTTENNFHLAECFAPSSSTCCLEPACALAPMLDEAMTEFMSVLDRYTLADLLAPRKALSALMAIPSD